MSDPSIDGLKLALLDPESASYGCSDDCSDYPQKLDHSKIKKITIEKLRCLPKDRFHCFNPSYNALIGGRGSGKSTILECLRLGLARENEILAEGADGAHSSNLLRILKEKTSRHSPGMMLNDTKITVEVSKGQDELEEKFGGCSDERDKWSVFEYR